MYLEKIHGVNNSGFVDTTYTRLIVVGYGYGIHVILMTLIACHTNSITQSMQCFAALKIWASIELINTKIVNQRKRNLVAMLFNQSVGCYELDYF